MGEDPQIAVRVVFCKAFRGRTAPQAYVTVLAWMVGQAVA